MSLVSDVGGGSVRPSYSPPPPVVPERVYTPPIPVGDGTFSSQVQGTQAQPATDLQLAEMSNDSYDLATPSTTPGEPASTGTQSEAALKADGFTRLQPSEDGKTLVGADGETIAIDPARLDDPSSGLRAAIYQNADGQYVVAFAGTDIKQLADLKADATQAFGLENKQYNQAIALAKDAEVAFGDGNVVFTGHSLGGGLASAAALATGASAVTFNSAGLSNETLRTLGFNPNAARDSVADSGQVRRYITNGDPLSAAQQDIPALPIPVPGAVVPLSPPDAVGHELRVSLPDGVTPLGIAAHGGSGDHTSYVDALKQNTAYEPQDPGFLTNTLANGGELVFNELGTVIGGVKDTVTDAIDTGKSLYGDIKSTLQEDYGNGRYVDGTVSVIGDIADNSLNLLGDTASNGLSLLGDTAQNVTDAGGQLLRDAGDGTILEKPADFLAGLVEGGGSLLSKGADGLGDGVSWVTDKGGDVVEAGVDLVADGLQGATDGLQWLGGKTVEGAQWLGEKTVDGAQWLGEKTVEGAQWLGGKTVDGVQWVGGKLSDGAKAVNNAMPWNW